MNCVAAASCRFFLNCLAALPSAKKVPHPKGGEVPFLPEAVRLAASEILFACSYRTCDYLCTQVIAEGPAVEDKIVA